MASVSSGWDTSPISNPSIHPPLSTISLNMWRKNNYVEIIHLWFPTHITIVSHINLLNLISGYIPVFSLLTYVASGKSKYSQTKNDKERIFDQYISYPKLLLEIICTIFTILFTSLYLSHPLGKFSNYLSYQNIEKGGIICPDAPTIHICTSPWKLMVFNCHPYGKKWIEPHHSYTWDFLR